MALEEGARGYWLTTFILRFLRNSLELDASDNVLSS